ncbi:MAG: hypothetical protein AAB471_01065, partial [Patescibacteria group bacterium]
AARQAHNLKVVGSNPTPATSNKTPREIGEAAISRGVFSRFLYTFYALSEICNSLFSSRLIS